MNQHKFLLTIIIFLTLVSLSSIRAQTTWGQVTPAGSYARDWNATAINGDGTVVVAGIYGKRLYISTDSGTSWNETQPAGAVDMNWKTTSISSNGNIIIAGAYDGRLYLSSNRGTNWSEIAPHGMDEDKFWQTTAMSSDGTKIVAGINGERLYISTNSGVTWDETTPAGNASKGWYASAMSDDGSKIIAGVYGEWLYISTDGGSSWDVTDPIPDDPEKNKNWSSVSMNSDGSKIVAGIYSERLLISSDIGVNWTEVQPSGDADYNWNTTAITAYGNYILAGVFYSVDGDEGYMYLSSDGGSNWSQQVIPVTSIQRWVTSSISADGSKAIIGSSPSGRLYMNTSPLPVELISFTGDIIDDNIVFLEWETATEINNYGFNVECTIDNVQWETKGFVQGHGTTNSPKCYSFTDPLNLTLNPNLTSIDYRLKQIDNDGSFAYSKIVTVDLTSITDIKDEGLPRDYSLSQNYPNPFNPSTTINFELPEKGFVDLRIYNILGKEVITLLDEELPVGYHEVKFSQTNISSGIYIYKINVTNKFSSVKKMLLIK